MARLNEMEKLDDAVDSFNLAFDNFRDAHNSISPQLLEAWTAMEQTYHDFVIRERPEAIAFAQWAQDPNNLQEARVREVTRLKFTEHYQAQKDDVKTEIRKLCKSFTTDLWKLYLLFGDSVMGSRRALKLLLSMRKHDSELTLDTCLTTLEKLRRGREGNRSRHVRKDVTVFTPQDVTNALALLCPVPAGLATETATSRKTRAASLPTPPPSHSSVAGSLEPREGGVPLTSQSSSPAGMFTHLLRAASSQPFEV